MARVSGTGRTLKEHHSIFDGLAHIFQQKSNGDVWQFRMWLPNEKKHYRKSLKTTNFNRALVSGKELALELNTNMSVGKKNFGITVEELLELYLENREKDIGDEDGQITKGTWKALRSKLKQGILMLGLSRKVSHIEQNAIENYRQRRTENRNVGAQTILNEQASLNCMWKWAYKNGHTHFEMLDFRKLSKRSHVHKRSVFTDKQYDKLVRYMRTYSSLKNCETVWGYNNRLLMTKQHMYLERKMVQDMILILANTGLRIGECRQLVWGNLSDEQTLTNKKTEKKTELVYITVPKHITKVRVERRFFTYGREYFDRLKDRQQFTESHHLIFSMDGKKTLSANKWAKHWSLLMKGIGLDNHYELGLTWYSLRHFAISKKIASGVDIIDLSKIVGTAVDNIEKVYLDYNKEMSRSAALKTFKKNDDGTYSQIRRDEM